MSDFFKLKRPRWGKCIRAVLFLAIAVPYSTALLPCGGAKEQAYLDQVILKIEDMRDKCEDPEVREVLDYAARRYRKIGPFNVQIRSCGPWAAGINVFYCPGITVDPSNLDSVSMGVVVVVHEAQHDYFPYMGHKHFRIYGT